MQRKSSNHYNERATQDASGVAQFVMAAQAQGLAFQRGDSKAANREGARLQTAYRELMRGEWQSKVLELLHHPNEFVRCATAARTLAFAPAKSEAVLVDLANQAAGVVRLNAEMILQEWKKGGFYLD